MQTMRPRRVRPVVQLDQTSCKSVIEEIKNGRVFFQRKIITVSPGDSFEGIRFPGEINFSYSIFVDCRISFYRAVFPGSAFFVNTVFEKDVFFDYATFYGNTDFEDVLFKAKASFRWANLKGQFSTNDRALSELLFRAKQGVFIPLTVARTIVGE